MPFRLFSGWASEHLFFFFLIVQPKCKDCETNARAHDASRRHSGKSLNGFLTVAHLWRLFFLPSFSLSLSPSPTPPTFVFYTENFKKPSFLWLVCLLCSGVTKIVAVFLSKYSCQNLSSQTHTHTIQALFLLYNNERPLAKEGNFR